jgi:putative transposase
MSLGTDRRPRRGTEGTGLGDADAVPASLVRTIGRLAGDLEDLTDRTIAQGLRELPTYAAVPTSALRASVERNLNIALGALRSGVAPAPDQLPEAEITGRERARQGVPIEDMMRAYRLNIGNVQRRFLDLAALNGVPAETALDGARLLWSVSDAFTVRLALAYQELTAEDALHDAHHRSGFVRSLLAGTVDRAGLDRGCTLYGLDPGASYRAVRARGGRGAEELRRRLERAGGVPGRPALAGVLGGDCVGVVARRPEAGEDWVAGIGPEVPLAGIADSYRTATRALDVAAGLGRTGVFGLEELTWRLAAASHDDVGRHLVTRYLAPLRAEGEFGLLLEDTVRAYVDNGLSIRETAEALVVHVNTLRYRLRRFGEITGVSLSSAHVLVELVWALELEALHGS